MYNANSTIYFKIRQQVDWIIDLVKSLSLLQQSHTSLVSPNLQNYAKKLSTQQQQQQLNDAAIIVLTTKLHTILDEIQRLSEEH